jgi:hypothetical protein
VLNKLAIIVTTGCATRMRAECGLGAALVPGIGGIEWESGVWNRIVAFRDFGVRFLGLQKCHGRSLISREEVGEPGHIIPFDITSDGRVVERMMTKATEGGVVLQKRPKSSPIKPRKRNVDEIADSDGEDVDEFGWAGTDEAVFAAEGLLTEGSTTEGAAESA